MLRIDIEPKITEYFIASVERYKYIWQFREEHTDSRYDLWFEIDDWCTETFGEQGMWGGPISTWKRMGPSYYFQNEEDRFLFVLKWS